MENKCGFFEIAPSKEFTASEYVMVVMTYTVGSKGVKTGGVLKIGLPNMGWGEPLTPYLRGDYEVYKGKGRQICIYKPCNTTCRIESRKPVGFLLYSRGSQNMLGPYNNWSWWITVKIEDGNLEEGDKIVITYGDTSFGEKGARVQPFKEEGRVWFTAFMDAEASGKFVQAEGSPVICRVKPGQIDKALVTAPSIVKGGGTIMLKLSCTDSGLNAIAKENLGGIEKIIVSDRNGNPVAAKIPSSAEDCTELSCNSPEEDYDFYDVKVITKEKTIEGKSNPVLLGKNMPNIYWGDLHCHSFYHMYNEKLGYGDPCTSPDELFKYAKNISHLDFAAITDGRGALPDNAGWREAQNAVVKNYSEGEFVTLKGWEMQMGTDGHRNVIYKNDVLESYYEEDVFQNASVWGSSGEKGMNDAMEVFEGRKDIITIPHHPLVWMNWDVYDSALDRLVEIYSCWGSSEYTENDMWDKSSPRGQSVVEALNRGYKLGFVGGSDSHTGYVGRSLMDADRYEFCRYKAGYTAVFAPELTREAVFDALQSRHCYATTGARMIIIFTVEGCRMGSEVPYASKKEEHLVRFTAVGTDKIRLIEIIRDGQAAYKIEPFKEYVCDGWTDASEQGKSAHYYYLRVTQVDGNRAWSSPVWV